MDYRSLNWIQNIFQDEEEDEGAAQLDDEWRNYRDAEPSKSDSRFKNSATDDGRNHETSLSAASNTANLLGDDFIDDIPETADLLGS